MVTGPKDIEPHRCPGDSSGVMPQDEPQDELKKEPGTEGQSGVDLLHPGFPVQSNSRWFPKASWRRKHVRVWSGFSADTLTVGKKEKL